MTRRILSLIVLLIVASGGVRADAASSSPTLFGGLPLDIAIKEVRGNGLRTFAKFEDPDCPFCRQLDMETDDMTDVTVYTFLYPILSPSSRKTAEAIWCSSDRSKAWRARMISRKAPKVSACDTRAIDKVIALGKAMKILGVPTIFLATGERYHGANSKIELEMAISSPKVLEFQARLGKKSN